jgi:hypothetical protein
MLRPTHRELLTGLQRTITEVLLPDLTSPYARDQAMMAVAMLAFAASTLESQSAFDIGEIKDLRATCASIARLSTRGLPRKSTKLRAAAKSGARGAKKSPPDRRGMEAAIAEFAAALALKQIEGALARHVRGYLRRHLERMRGLLGVMQPGG